MTVVKKSQIYTSKFNTVKQVADIEADWTSGRVCRVKFNNKKILDLFLSAVTNSSGGFIAAADAVSWCIFHLLINGVYTLKRDLEATEPITVHKQFQRKDRGSPSGQNNMTGFHH